MHKLLDEDKRDYQKMVVAGDKSGSSAIALLPLQKKGPARFPGQALLKTTVLTAL
jgi:hypothetical protein